jgi:hypothetical protein
MHGKLQSVLEKIDHGHHVFRACGRNAVLRMYEKLSTFLRLEALSNNLKDFALKKSRENLAAVRQTLAAVTDRLAAFEAEALNVQVDFPLFQPLAVPITCGRTRVPGIKIHDTRMICVTEVLLHRDKNRRMAYSTDLRGHSRRIRPEGEQLLSYPTALCHPQNEGAWPHRTRW